MKFESLMLQGLFAVCLLSCLLTLGMMLVPQTSMSYAATQPLPVVAVASAAG